MYQCKRSVSTTLISGCLLLVNGDTYLSSSSNLDFFFFFFFYFVAYFLGWDSGWDAPRLPWYLTQSFYWTGPVYSGIPWICLLNRDSGYFCKSKGTPRMRWCALRISSDWRVAFQNRWRGNAAFTRRRRQVNKRNYPQTQHSRSFLHAACIVTTLITRTQRNYHSWISPWSYQVRGSLGIFHDVGHTTIARFFVRQGTAPAASSNPSGLAPPPTHPWGKGSARMFSRLIVFP